MKIIYQVLDYINKKNLENSFKKFRGAFPFDHCVVDNFFTDEMASILSNDFPEFDDPIWHQYDNPIEIKKVSNLWNIFPPTTYEVFSDLNSPDFVSYLSDISGIDPLYADNGLNGGGWHMLNNGGKLNPHLDYSMHPKLPLQRKINLIVYLNKNWKEGWGGELGLWSSENDGKSPKKIETIVPCFYNRAIFFDTTMNSWHGLYNVVNSPKDEFRKSLAIYYLTTPPSDVDKRGKALFAPTDDQKGNKDIEELIDKRSKVETAAEVYKK